MRIMTISFLTASLLLGAGTDPSASGANIGNTAMSVFGTKDGVNSRFAQPLMSNTQMKTVDGTKSFNAQMQCPASSKSVGIMFLPAGGNDYRLLINQDTDLNGAMDYTYDTSVLGRTVSGVCTNGVLMCNPAGSWNDCKSYVWDVNNKKITLRNVNANSSELGACFCSNTSCGVTSLVPQIYENIGGGISATIMRSNPLFLQSKSEWSFAEMTYYLYGQDKTNCTGLGASGWDQYGEKNPTQYYDAQVPPNTSIADVAIQQGGDPNSYYSLMSHQNQVAYNSAGDKISMPNTTTCTIKHLPAEQTKTLDQYVLYRSPSPGAIAWGFPLIDNYNVTAGTFTDKFYIVTAGTYKISGAMDNYGTVSVDGTLIVNVGGWIDTSATINLAVGEHTITTTGANIDGPWGTASAVYNPDGSMLWNIRNGQPPTLQKYMTIVNDNGCASNESNGCKIQDEQVCDANGGNCIYTVRGGTRQNISIAKKCTTGNFSTSCADGGVIGSTLNDGTSTTLYTGTDAWFYIKRTYQCDSQNINLDTSKMSQAAGTAYKANESSTTMTYTNYDGSTVTVNNMPTGDECPTPACTVKRPSTDTSQFADATNRSQTVAGTSTTQTVVKTCTKSGGTTSCPLDASLNETMVEDCSCSGNMTGFKQAITTLGAVSEASKDMICSQN